MGGDFIQSGNLTGAVGSEGILQANVTSDVILAAVVTSEGELQGEITATENLKGEMSAEKNLEGEIQIPEKVIIEGAVAPKISEVTLLASAWVGENNLYQQVVDIEGVTEKSQVDLTPNIEQLLVFYEKDICFVSRNNGGVVTIYVIGQKPANDYTIQVTITEVAV